MMAWFTQAREPVRRRPVTVSLRQMLNQEISQEAHRRAANTLTYGAGCDGVSAGGGKRGREEDGETAAAPMPDKVMRAMAMSKAMAGVTKSRGSSAQFRVLYRFNEGFTNAVRRFVTMDKLVGGQTV